MVLLLVNTNGAHAHARAVVYSTRLAALQTRSWRVAWLDRRIEVAHPAGPGGLSFLQGVSLAVSVLVTETHVRLSRREPTIIARHTANFAATGRHWQPASSSYTQAELCLALPLSLSVSESDSDSERASESGRAQVRSGLGG